MVSVDWVSKDIYIPQADLTLISPGVYELNLNTLRLALKDLEDGEGMPFLDTHQHIAPISLAGFTLARVVEFINDYTVTFQAGNYAVNLVGANTNLPQVATVNGVSIRPSNSAGLIQVSTGSGLSTEQATQLQQLAATLQSSGVFASSALANVPTPTGMALEASVQSAIASLASALQLLRADERKRAGYWQKLDKDTKDVILSKLVTQSGENIDLVDGTP